MIKTCLVRSGALSPEKIVPLRWRRDRSKSHSPSLSLDSKCR